MPDPMEVELRTNPHTGEVWEGTNLLGAMVSGVVVAFPVGQPDDLRMTGYRVWQSWPLAPFASTTPGGSDAA